MKNKYKEKIVKYVLTMMVMLAFVSIPALAANPSITSISPSSKNVGDLQFTLTVNGNDFGKDSVVRFAGSDLSVISQNKTQLTATVLASYLTTAGTFDITVKDGTKPTSNPVQFTVNKVDQTITFAALSDKISTDPDFAVVASATSGLTVSFGASGVCTVSGSTVHITGSGSCTITASQAGNDAYNAAPDVDRSFTVDPPADPTPELSTLILTATGLIGLFGLVRLSKRK